MQVFVPQPRSTCRLRKACGVLRYGQLESDSSSQADGNRVISLSTWPCSWQRGHAPGHHNCFWYRIDQLLNYVDCSVYGHLTIMNTRYSHTLMCRHFHTEQKCCVRSYFDIKMKTIFNVMVTFVLLTSTDLQCVELDFMHDLKLHLS